MHVLLVSTFFPFPQNCGKARVLAGLCSFLARHPKVKRVSYFHIARGRAEQAGALRAHYQQAPNPAFGEVCRNIAGALLAGRRPALQEAFTFSRSARRALWAYIQDEKPDVVVADTIRSAQYLESADRPPSQYLLYLDDLFSLRYERILELMDRCPEGAGDPLGNFVSFIPARLRPLASRRSCVKLLLNYERGAVRRREEEVVRHFERSLLISPEEVQILRTRTGRKSIHAMKLLTDALDEPALCAGQSRDFVFLGDLKLAHNRQAVEKLVAEGAAALERELPGYRVLIVGKSAPPELAAACARTSNFELTGFVPDLYALLLRARGMLAPLQFGSGVKIKCLEALRLGVPLVASRFGVEGLGLQPEVEYLHADDVASVIRQMRRLTDDAEHARLVASSHEWFTNNYAPDVVWREYEELFLTFARPRRGRKAVEVAA